MEKNEDDTQDLDSLLLVRRVQEVARENHRRIDELVDCLHREAEHSHALLMLLQKQIKKTDSLLLRIEILEDALEDKEAALRGRLVIVEGMLASGEES